MTTQCSGNLVGFAVGLLLTVLFPSDAHAHQSHALTFELPDKEQACFFQKFEGSTRYVFSYEVIRGGNLDVDASVESPNGLTLHEQTKTKKGLFEFETSYGDYKFCFRFVTVRLVGFLDVLLETICIYCTSMFE